MKTIIFSFVWTCGLFALTAWGIHAWWDVPVNEIISVAINPFPFIVFCACWLALIYPFRMIAWAIAPGECEQ